jgi:pimeloyl-ACP methyl ester carboxylesterase
MNGRAVARKWSHYRLGRLVRRARVEIVPGAGHALPTDQPALVTRHILEAAELT